MIEEYEKSFPSIKRPVHLFIRVDITHDSDFYKVPTGDANVWQLRGRCTHPVGTLEEKVLHCEKPVKVTLPVQGFKARASPLATNRQLPQSRNNEPVIIMSDDQ